MKLYGQRWVYRIGNQTVTVDNAYSWSMWGLERMLVNDETAHSASGSMVFSRKFQEEWLSSLGEGMVRVSIKGGLTSMICETTLDGNRLLPDECFVTVWNGDEKNWPENSTWKPTEPGHAIRIFRPVPLKSPTKG